MSFNHVRKVINRINNNYITYVWYIYNICLIQNRRWKLGHVSPYYFMGIHDKFLHSSQFQDILGYNFVHATHPSGANIAKLGISICEPENYLCCMVDIDICLQQAPRSVDLTKVQLCFSKIRPGMGARNDAMGSHISTTVLIIYRHFHTKSFYLHAFAVYRTTF